MQNHAIALTMALTFAFTAVACDKQEEKKDDDKADAKKTDEKKTDDKAGDAKDEKKEEGGW
jgi:hypothetical protein